jgi:hypothetical protein
MSKRSIRTVFGLGLTALALAVTVAAAVPVAAQAQTAAAATAATDLHRGGPAGKGTFAAGDEYLTEALGITQDELDAAQQTAQTAAIDKALAEGLITQAQADALKNGTELGREGRGGRGGGMLRALLALSGSDAIDMKALLAEELNITTDELTAAETEAQDLALAAAVEEGRTTQAQADLIKAQNVFRSYLAREGVSAQILKQAVEAGAITQAQADALLQAQRIGGGFGGMRGFDGFRGRGHRGGGF